MDMYGNFGSGVPINSALFGGGNMGVEPKIGVFLPPHIIHLFIGFSVINHHPFWGRSTPFFGKHPYNDP